MSPRRDRAPGTRERVIEAMREGRFSRCPELAALGADLRPRAELGGRAWAGELALLTWRPLASLYAVR